MICKSAIVLAMLMHLHQASVLFEAPAPAAQLCTLAPLSPLSPYAHCLVILATACLLWDVNIWSRWVVRLPDRADALAEFLASLLVLELAGHLVWGAVERRLCQAAQGSCELLEARPAGEMHECLERMGWHLGTMLLAALMLNYMLLAEQCTAWRERAKSWVRLVRLYWLGWCGFLAMDAGQQHCMLLKLHMHGQRLEREREREQQLLAADEDRSESC